MLKLALATALMLPVTMAPALAETLTVVGPNGGTIEKSRDCSRGDGQAECTVDTVRTSPGGKVSTKTRVRTTKPGESVARITVTGPGGETRTRERTVTWGN
jgi:hypothetical protein